MRFLTLFGLVAALAAHAVKAGNTIAELDQLEESGLISTRTYEVTPGVHIVAADDADENPVAYFVVRDEGQHATDSSELLKKSIDIILDARDVPIETILARDITLHPDHHDDSYDSDVPLTARDLLPRVGRKRPTRPPGRHAKCGGFCSLSATCPQGCKYCTVAGNRNGSGLPHQTKRCMRTRFPPGHAGNPVAQHA